MPAKTLLERLKNRESYWIKQLKKPNEHDKKLIPGHVVFIAHVKLQHRVKAKDLIWHHSFFWGQIFTIIIVNSKIVSAKMADGQN